MAIKTIQTNDKNDIILGDGKNIVFLEGIKGLQQSVREYGLMRKGENIFNIEEGVDYFGTFFSSPKDIEGARASIAKAITKHPDVLSIESLVVTENNNELFWVARLNTIYGKVTAGTQK